ncbi:MAG: radical SAM protein [Clostridia bacterium]|nr:radical SAM protein [Clostridia bacterium]
MKPFMKNAYVEITNVCNLACDFCPGHKRSAKHMTSEEFSVIAEKLDGKVENVFLHIMGEPLLHPELDKILQTADKMSFNVKITTNGTLMREGLATLIKSKNLKTVCISLHSFEGNLGDSSGNNIKEYLYGCFEGARALAESGKFAVLRLWNLDGGHGSGKNSLNDRILASIREFFPDGGAWKKTYRGERIADHVFLEWGEHFDWPDISEAKECGAQEYEGKCYGLLTQFGILSDGSVVPCCLDRNGDITLGNIFREELGDILATERAVKMREGMLKRRFTEPLCRTCGFSRDSV